MALPPDVSAGTTGHPDAHDALHTRYNALTPGGVATEPVPVGLLGTGTPTSVKFLNGLGAWATPVGGGEAPVDVGVRYVTEDGHDGNTGLSWATAFATPQGAYDDLCAFADANWAKVNGRTHVGSIHIARKANGTPYDVGRLELRKTHSAEFHGHGITRAQDDFVGLVRFTTTSAVETEMVALTDDITTSNGYGFKFINLGFTIDCNVATSVTAIIRANDCNFVDVKGCRANATNMTNGLFFLETDGNADNSWWDVSGNRTHGMGFYRCVGTQFNNNRSQFSHNQVFGTRSGTGLPVIDALFDLDRVNDATFSNNNCESANIGFKVNGGDNNLFLNNAGECDSFDTPFYNFNSCADQLVVGGRATVGGQGTSVNGVLVLVDGTSRRIVLVHAAIEPTGTATAIKDKAVDNSDNKGNLTVMTANGFRMSRHALDLPNLGDAPENAKINTAGAYWYDEVNHVVKTRDGVGSTRLVVRNGREIISGSSTILDATSSLVVAHGMPTTPTTVSATPAGNELVWVTSIGATNFTLNRAGTSGALIVKWTAHI